MESKDMFAPSAPNLCPVIEMLFTKTCWIMRHNTTVCFKTHMVIW